MLRTAAIIVVICLGLTTAVSIVTNQINDNTISDQHKSIVIQKQTIDDLNRVKRIDEAGLKAAEITLEKDTRLIENLRKEYRIKCADSHK